MTLNKQPVVFPWTPMEGEDPDEITARADALRGQGEFFARVGAALARRYLDQEPSEHVEDQIYGCFYTDADKLLLGEFHRVPWEERLTILGRIEDERLRRLGMRVMLFERPDLVGEDYRRRAMQTIRDRWETEESGGWTTLSVVERELAEIEQEGMLGAVELEAWRRFYVEVRSGLSCWGERA